MVATTQPIDHNNSRIIIIILSLGSSALLRWPDIIFSLIEPFTYCANKIKCEIIMIIICYIASTFDRRLASIRSTTHRVPDSFCEDHLVVKLGLSCGRVTCVGSMRFMIIVIIPMLMRPLTIPSNRSSYNNEGPQCKRGSFSGHNQSVSPNNMISINFNVHQLFHWMLQFLLSLFPLATSIDDDRLTSPPLAGYLRPGWCDLAPTFQPTTDEQTDVHHGLIRNVQDAVFVEHQPLMYMSRGLLVFWPVIAKHHYCWCWTTLADHDQVIDCSGCLWKEAGKNEKRISPTVHQPGRNYLDNSQLIDRFTIAILFAVDEE